MALDAATLELTARELKTVLADAKIAKLFEPTRDELVITLRTRTDTYALLLSARSGSARGCLTEETFENPETPPSFCMLMRKHLTGGKLLDVHMEPGDRIVYFDFQCTNEMGDLVRNTLCAELMGRYSNLVLVQNGKIIDALKRVDFEDSDIRQLLPGLTYTTPPKPARPDFLQVSSASIVAAACQRDLPVADALNKTVAGVGPVVCREAAWRAFDGEHLLANELTEEQKCSLMAAIDQLKVLAEGIGVEVYTEEGNKNPVQIAENAIKYAREHSLDTVIVDTAGRLAVDQEMMDEISRVHAAVKPSETLFVVDSMTGQDAVNTAKAFNDRLNFDGVVLTKLDGDTRGGAALSIKATVEKPIKFSSTGEKMEALEVFHPERLADRIMGMGDIVSLVEKVNAQYDEAKAKELERKFRKNQFGFDDFLGQIAQIKKMGNLKDLASMIPGMGKALKNVEISDDVFKQTEAIINSMTPLEREKPEIIDAKRRERLAKGSGTTMAEVNKLMKQFEDTHKMMKAVAGGNMKMPKLPGRGFRR